MAPRQSRKSEPVQLHASESEEEPSTQEDDFDPVKVAQGIVNKVCADDNVTRYSSDLFPPV